MEASAPEPDAIVDRLATLFRSHPAWTRAAALLSADACSNLRFPHRAGEVWHLARVAGVTRLEPGALRDADLELTIPPGAVGRLEATRGGVGDFAVALFELAVERDEALRVDLRILAPFSRLMRRGYLRLLVAGGPAVLAWGAAHGVGSLGELRRWIGRMRSGGGVSPRARMPHAPGSGRSRSRGARKDPA
ncbi:MAG: hypothetical protein ACHQ3O_01405 [Candidatus Limnocylindria bacterium]|jgi:hypothetical protein